MQEEAEQTASGDSELYTSDTVTENKLKHRAENTQSPAIGENAELAALLDKVGIKQEQGGRAPGE